MLYTLSEGPVAASLSESSALLKALGVCWVVFPAGYVVFLVKGIET